MAILRSCCCCISLRTGGVILGVLTMIGALILATTSSLTLWYSLHEKAKVDMLLQEQIDNIPELTQENSKYVLLVARLLMGFYIAMSLISVVCSLMLIYGALNRRKGFLVPYLVSDGIRCVYLVFYAMYEIYELCTTTSGENGQNPSRGVALVSIILVLALQIYFWICVYSLYQAYGEERRLQQMPHHHYPGQSPYNPHMQVAYSPVKA